MWYRIDAKAMETGISYTKTARKFSFSPSSVYNTIVSIKRGLPPRDTDLRIVEALAKEMHAPLNYIVHGEIEEPTDNGNTSIDESVLNNIFDLSSGNYLSLLLLALLYLNETELKSIKEDIAAYKKLATNHR